MLSLFSSTFSGSGFFKKERIKHPTSAPMKIAIAYINGFPIVGRTKIPPCGARSVQLNAIDNPLAVAEPIIQEGITLNGSFALNLQDNQSSPLLTAYRLAVQYCFFVVTQ